jgi:FkbM family methyltransferase
MQSLYSSNLHDDAKRLITPFHDVEKLTKLEGNEKILQGQEIHSNWQLSSRQNVLISAIIDVGARQGTPKLYKLFPNTFFILIDPQDSGEAGIKRRPKSSYVFRNVAVGSKEGTLMLDEMNAKSSPLQRTELTASTVPRQYKVKVSTLDKEIDALPANSKDPVGIKIDTEGYELEVVKSLNCNLSRLAFIVAEVSLKKRFESSYSFAEFINYMDSKGFSLADLLGFHPNYLPG